VNISILLIHMNINITEGQREKVEYRDVSR